MRNTEKFAIQGEDGSIKVRLKQVFDFPTATCHWGGYDAVATIKIKAGDFRVISECYLSTGQLYELLQQFIACNEQLSGVVPFTSYEGNLKFEAQYDNLGHVSLTGSFWANSQFDNKLLFTIVTDQTFIRKTIGQLVLIVRKYGNNQGVTPQLDTSSV